MSALRASCPRCRTLTAVAIDDGYECHSCGTTYQAGLVRVPRAWGSGGEAMVEAASLDLPYPETLVVDAPTLEEQSAALATGLPARPLVIGGCCCAHVGAIRGLAARQPFTDGGSVLERWLGQLLAKRYAREFAIFGLANRRIYDWLSAYRGGQGRATSCFKSHISSELSRQSPADERKAELSCRPGRADHQSNFDGLE